MGTTVMVPHRYITRNLSRSIGIETLVGGNTMLLLPILTQETTQSYRVRQRPCRAVGGYMTAHTHRAHPPWCAPSSSAAALSFTELAFPGGGGAAKVASEGSHLPAGGLMAAGSGQGSILACASMRNGTVPGFPCNRQMHRQKPCARHEERKQRLTMMYHG